MTRFVSLFRGINVGGNKKVRMDELKELYSDLRLKDVATYIQSGNVVCTCDDGDLDQISRKIEDGFAQKFGFSAKVIVRTSAELSDIIANNPFQDQHMEESRWVVVMCLATRPDSAALEELQKTYAGPEEIHVIGQDVYIYYPTGIGRSKLSHALLEKTLKTVGTGRNWNTILQLQKMIQPASL